MPLRSDLGPAIAHPRALLTCAIIASTWAIGVSGVMPWPRLKTSGPSPKASSIASMPALQRLPAGDQSLRIQIALHGAFFLQAMRLGKRHGPVEAKRSCTRRGAVTVIAAAGALGEGNDRHIRMRGMHLAHNLGDRLDTEGREAFLVQHAGPRVEYLHAVGAGLDLSDEIGSRMVGKGFQQPPHCLRMPIGEESGRRLVRRTVAGNHVGSDRPRRAAKAYQRGFRRQVRRAGGAPSRKRAKDSRETCRHRDRSTSSAPIGVICGPRPSSKLRSRPSAWGTTRMSENRIDASKPKRRIGCSVTSTARSGL